MEVVLTGLHTVSPDEAFTHEVVLAPSATPPPSTQQQREPSPDATSRGQPQLPLSEWLQIRWVCCAGGAPGAPATMQVTRGGSTREWDLIYMLAPQVQGGSVVV